MHFRMRKLLGAVLLLGSAWAQIQGTVTGTVIDEMGKPIAKAKVHIAEKGPFAGHRLIQFYETDSAGHFLIGRVPWGTYVVMAGKEDAGYPDTRLAFYSNLAVPTVTLAPDFPTAEVNLKLGPKAGVLEVGPVTDDATGKEIRSAAITLRRAGNDFFLTTSTTVGRILVPSMTEVVVGITAPGYKPWPPSDQPNEKRRILLKPEEVQRLQVSLQPEQPTFTNEKK
jgi:hypothetical protein